MRERERGSPKGKGVKGKANEQTSIFKKFSFSTFFVTCFAFFPLLFFPIVVTHFVSAFFVVGPLLLM